MKCSHDYAMIFFIFVYLTLQRYFFMQITRLLRWLKASRETALRVESIDKQHMQPQHGPDTTTSTSHSRSTPLPYSRYRDKHTDDADRSHKNPMRSDDGLQRRYLDESHHEWAAADVIESNRCAEDVQIHLRSSIEILRSLLPDPDALQAIEYVLLMHL